MTQAYELFANRHLRKIQEASHGVAVNTKYELTAANTNKLWSKFEADLLSRPNLNNIGADNDARKSYGQTDFIDHGGKMAAIATFAPHDPDSSIADNTNTIGEESRSLLQSSYILHSY